MYSLDVNFLHDRPDYRPQDQQIKATPKPAGAMKPLFVGLAVGLLFPALVGGLWLYLQQQNAQLTTRQSELDSELARLKIGEQKVKQLEEEIANVNEETEALATVFNDIKPWSALLQDIRERTPPNVQIRSIKQTQAEAAASAAPTPAASPGANAAATSAPMPTSQLEITGTARSFDDVAYFQVALQRSPFFKKEETQLASARLIDNPTQLEVPQTQNQSGAQVTYTLPKVVEYTIQTSLSDAKASELLRELDRKGAVGLVSRIRILQDIQDKGATKQ